ncbi:MAG: GtrA family protein [bacterium]
MTRAQIVRLLRFAAVGGSGVVVNLVVFQAMLFALRPASVPTTTAIPIANAVGIVVSIFTNFLLNDSWTWGDRLKGAARDWWRRLGRYYVSASLAAGVQLLVTSFSHAWLWAALLPDWNGIALAPNSALLSGIACGMGINFFASHTWAFKDANNT